MSWIEIFSYSVSCFFVTQLAMNWMRRRDVNALRYILVKEGFTQNHVSELIEKFKYTSDVGGGCDEKTGQCWPRRQDPWKGKWPE